MTGAINPRPKTLVNSPPGRLESGFSHERRASALFITHILSKAIYVVLLR